MVTARYTTDLDGAHTAQPSGPTAPATDPKAVRSRLVVPLLNLIFAGILDALLTLVGIAQGGRELNPSAVWLLSRGPVAFVGARVATLALVGAGLLYLAPSAPRTARACVVALVLFFALVDAFSLFQLVKP
ncbi:MAG: hypothetical protein QOE90_2400 [Thermoplasmata archaeon]|jgi:hypothetical protein|nr:hypothetical protein [Thermoplasmata archaeon]